MFKLAGFVGRHMIPQNSSAIPISQSMSLPSNEPDNLAQANPNIPHSIYQPQMTPMTVSINSGAPVSSSMSSMHQQSHPGVPPHTQPMMSGHQQPPMSNMGLQHHLPAGQPMMPVQHQQPVIGHLPTMAYGGPVHMGQYSAQPIPSHQVNPQPSAPNQIEQQPKVEQPQVAELISFD